MSVLERMSALFGTKTINFLMGSLWEDPYRPLSGLLADIFINYLKKIILNSSPNSQFVKYWACYIDDVVGIWNGPQEALQSLLTHLNSFDPAIAYTVEIGGQSINYLDLTISLHKTEMGLRAKFDI